MNAQRNSAMDFSMLAGESYFPVSNTSTASFPDIDTILSREVSSSSLPLKARGKYGRIEVIRGVLHDPIYNLSNMTLCGECSVAMKKESQQMLLQLHRKLDSYKSFYDSIQTTSASSNSSRGQGGIAALPQIGRSPPRPGHISRGVSFSPSVEEDEELQKVQMEIRRLQAQEDALSQTIERYQQELRELFEIAQQGDERGTTIADAQDALDDELRTAFAVLNEALFLDAGRIQSQVEKERALLGVGRASRSMTVNGSMLSVLSPAFDSIDIQYDWVEINGLRLRCHASPLNNLNWTEINRAWSAAVTLLLMLRSANYLVHLVTSTALAPLHREILRCYPTLALFSVHNTGHMFANANTHHTHSYQQPNMNHSPTTVPVWSLQWIPLSDRVLCNLTHPSISHSPRPYYNAGTMTDRPQKTSTTPLVLEGGVSAQAQDALHGRLSMYQRSVLWFILSILATKVEMDGERSILFQEQCESPTCVISIALWELVVTAALGYPLGLLDNTSSPFATAIPSSPSSYVPSMVSIQSIFVKRKMKLSLVSTCGTRLFILNAIPELINIKICICTG